MKWIASILSGFGLALLCAAQTVSAMDAQPSPDLPTAPAPAAPAEDKALAKALDLHTNGIPATNSVVQSTNGLQPNPGDKLIFSIAEDPQSGGLSRQTFVDPKFNVHFPVSQGFPDEIIINAKDKTFTQIQKELKQKLDATFYKNATVTLEPGAQALQPGQIVVTGPVRNNFVPLLPGEHKMLLETILQCGPSEFANLRKVKVMRINPVTGKMEDIFYNVEAIEKDPTKDVPVYDHDRINLIEKNILFQ
jgi:protein involved in polysaccharide export with SLBB domain